MLGLTKMQAQTSQRLRKTCAPSSKKRLTVTQFQLQHQGKRKGEGRLFKGVARATGDDDGKQKQAKEGNGAQKKKTEEEKLDAFEAYYSVSVLCVFECSFFSLPFHTDARSRVFFLLLFLIPILSSFFFFSLSLSLSYN